MWPASERRRSNGAARSATRGSVMVHGQRTGANLLEASRARDHHSAWTIALHWISVLGIIVVAVSGLLREILDDGPLRVALLEVHKQTGLFVLLVLAGRIGVRAAVGMADHAGDLPILLRRAAQLAHLVLYMMLLALPLLGLAVSNAHGVRVRLFGVLPLPSLVDEDADVVDALTDYHVWGAWVLLILVVAHVGAALWHHWVRRDAVLAAMLPLVRRRR